MEGNYILCKSVKASLTVEAVFVLPIFFFAVLAFLYFIQIVVLQEQVQASITEVASISSQYGHIYQEYIEKGEEKEKSTIRILEGFVDGTVFKSMFLNIAKQFRLYDSCIMGGMEAIQFYESSFMRDGETIEVIARYAIQLPIPFLRSQTMEVVQRVRTRAFVGLTCMNECEDNEVEEGYVYITPTGGVYHTRADCTYLEMDIISVGHEELFLRRNQSGAKYYPCESCIGQGHTSQSIVYITTYGTRYHTDRSCKKIHREVRKVKLSQVGSKRPCSKCAREGSDSSDE